MQDIAEKGQNTWRVCWQHWILPVLHWLTVTVSVEAGAVTVTVTVGLVAAARTVKNAKTKRKRLNVRANIVELVRWGVVVFPVGLLGVLRPPFYVCSTRRYLRCAILTLMANIADVF